MVTICLILEAGIGALGLLPLPPGEGWGEGERGRLCALECGSDSCRLVIPPHSSLSRNIPSARFSRQRARYNTTEQ